MQIYFAFIGLLGKCNETSIHFFPTQDPFFSTFGKIIFPEITQKMGKKDKKKFQKK